jgi:hypothetical protein
MPVSSSLKTSSLFSVKVTNAQQDMKHRISSFILYSGLVLMAGFSSVRSVAVTSQVHENPPPVFLGFDANDYPGDAVLPDLRKTFTFAGYWLNVPPGAKTNTWAGKRDALVRNSFGFLVLFNGRLSKEFKPPVDPSDLGARDAELAATTAQRDGFPANGSIVIYLDIEEGGRMLPSQINYIESWSVHMTSKGFVAGVYCSGIKVTEERSQTITTADDIRQRLPIIAAYFIYNDECPPSPGCVIWKSPPQPSQSGFPGALVWQYAQSPRRHNLTARCSASYSPDGNCYSPAGTDRVPLDLDVAVSPDPSTLTPRPAH